MNQAHVFISGNVQGTGYRQFVKSGVKQLGLTGWIRNTEDGGVEAIFCGDKEKIEKAIEICKEGPFLAEVKHLGYEWEELEEFSSFEVQ